MSDLEEEPEEEYLPPSVIELSSNKWFFLEKTPESGDLCTNINDMRIYNNGSYQPAFSLLLCLDIFEDKNKLQTYFQGKFLDLKSLEIVSLIFGRIGMSVVSIPE